MELDNIPILSSGNQCYKGTTSAPKCWTNSFFCALILLGTLFSFSLSFTPFSAPYGSIISDYFSTACFQYSTVLNTDILPNLNVTKKSIYHSCSLLILIKYFASLVVKLYVVIFVWTTESQTSFFLLHCALQRLYKENRFLRIPGFMLFCNSNLVCRSWGNPLKVQLTNILCQYRVFIKKQRQVENDKIVV